MTKHLHLFAALATVSALAIPAASLAQETPGTFKIPGTNTTLTLNGFVQVYGTYDISGRVLDIENLDWASIPAVQPLDDTPPAKETGKLYFTARTTRVGFSTNTPTPIGALVTRVEGDFNGPNAFQGQTFTNSVLFRLRHAYGTMRGFLVGQTWTQFLDFPSSPDTVDFNGPGTLALVRQPQIRYTYESGPFSAGVAAENPHNGGVGHIPDFTAKLGYTPAWGSAGLAVLTNQYRFSKAGDTTPNKHTVQGYGIAVSGSYKLFAKDTIVGLFVFGDGVGRYLFNAVANFSGLDSSGNLKLWRSTAYHVGLTHVWTDAFRSNVIWSQTFFDRNGIDRAGIAATDSYNADGTAETGFAPNKRIDQLFVNTFWDITKNAELGLEYEYARRHTFTGDNLGKEDRITANATYKFF
jgi:hypothetical protein